jgi:hypothetical protein
MACRDHVNVCIVLKGKLSFKAYKILFGTERIVFALYSLRDPMYKLRGKLFNDHSGSC